MNSIHDTHNPEPVKESTSGRCCSHCNTTKVAPARLSQLFDVTREDKEKMFSELGDRAQQSVEHAILIQKMKKAEEGRLEEARALANSGLEPPP